METEPVQGALVSALAAALLCGCDVVTAEAAVLDGISSWDGINHQSLLVGTFESTLRRRTNAINASSTGHLLPTELRRLLGLRPLLRDCFVLRMLLGFSLEVCTSLLRISVTEFEDALYAALNQLPLLISSRVDSHDNQRHPTSALERPQSG